MVWSPLTDEASELIVFHREGGSVPPAEYLAALQQVKEHNEWFSQNIIDQETIMVLPRFSLDRRDEYLP